MARRRAKAGDVFQVPVDDDHVAYGQVLSTEEFVHLVVFDGLHDAGEEHDLDAVVGAPVILYAWTRDDLFRDGTWTVVGRREPTAKPPIEFIEMADEPDEFQAVDWAGNVLRRASPDEVENAPFRSINSPESVQEAVEAWHGIRPWEEKHLSLRPWDERNADRDDEASRLLRKLRS